MLDLQQTFKYRIEKRHGKYKLEMVFWQMLLFFCVDIVPKIFVLLSASHNDNDDDVENVHVDNSYNDVDNKEDNDSDNHGNDDNNIADAVMPALERKAAL